MTPAEVLRPMEFERKAGWIWTAAGLMDKS